jgi:hypothetical protein
MNTRFSKLMGKLKKLVNLSYACGHFVSTKLTFDRIEIEQQFAATIRCPDCFLGKHQKLKDKAGGLRTIIAGSRTLTDADYGELLEALEGVDWEISEILSGGAKGGDRLGELYAQKRKIPLKVYPADWKTHGRKAGILRNSEMADDADALIALWDGTSKGTGNMIETATKRGLIVYIHNFVPF